MSPPLLSMLLQRAQLLYLLLTSRITRPPRSAHSDAPFPRRSIQMS
jgi:hypothetical protein